MTSFQMFGREVRLSDGLDDFVVALGVLHTDDLLVVFSDTGTRYLGDESPSLRDPPFGDLAGEEFAHGEHVAAHPERRQEVEHVVMFGAIDLEPLARMIGPAELGIGAAAVAVNVLLCVGASALFADALTQSPSTDPRELSSAVWAAAAVGPILYGVDPNYQNYTAINAWPSAAANRSACSDPTAPARRPCST